MALLFDGLATYVNLGEVVDADSPEMSLMAWCFVDVVEDSRIYAKTDGINEGDAFWQTGIEVAVGQKNRLKTAGVTTTLEGGGEYATGVWIHTGYTYRSAGVGGSGWLGYKNGVEILSAAGKSGNVEYPVGVEAWIGGNPPTPDFRIFSGRIADARRYNRELSAAEMQTIYACYGTDGIVDGLASRHLLNEGALGTAAVGAGTSKDVGPAADNGTPVASPFFIDDRLRFRRRIA